MSREKGSDVRDLDSFTIDVPPGNVGTSLQAPVSCNCTSAAEIFLFIYETAIISNYHVCTYSQAALYNDLLEKKDSLAVTLASTQEQLQQNVKLLQRKYNKVTDTQPLEHLTSTLKTMKVLVACLISGPRHIDGEVYARSSSAMLRPSLSHGLHFLLNVSGSLPFCSCNNRSSSTHSSGSSRSSTYSYDSSSGRHCSCNSGRRQSSNGHTGDNGSRIHKRPHSSTGRQALCIWIRQLRNVVACLLLERRPFANVPSKVAGIFVLKRQKAEPTKHTKPKPCLSLLVIVCLTEVGVGTDTYISHARLERQYAPCVRVLKGYGVVYRPASTRLYHSFFRVDPRVNAYAPAGVRTLYYGDCEYEEAKQGKPAFLAGWGVVRACVRILLSYYATRITVTVDMGWHSR
ncbi:unnamed protein product [Rangifer tarandus platyrhynchus]|uniref:Uncharacterized protein n=1 Tax=Rangifer tarandus platyrhynchus TaxID=3082113 RepID=A0ABN8XMB2_RANTA|nr:unnamed protein product [Rangifer tarandus platyrhynchus]